MTTVDFTTTLPRKRMAAGVLFTDPAGRVLLVEPTYKEVWEVPGGTVEPDESPLTAATREMQEELGLPLIPGRLLVVDWIAADGPRTEGVMFIFAGQMPPGAEITLPADELRSWAWCDPAEAAARLNALLARRITSAQAALAAGETHYLENGHRIP